METYTIRSSDVNNLVTGAAFLGTGGGGDPYIGGLMLKRAIERRGPVEVIRNAKSNNAQVVGSAMMGAPIVMIEKIPSGDEANKALKIYSEITGRKVEYITPLEIGGVNSTIPLIVASALGLPVLDGDGMGRAFPELQMTTFYFYGVDPSPVIVLDERGNVSVVEGIDGVWAEKIARVITLRYGGAAYISLYGTTLNMYNKTAVLDTLSLALHIGELLNQIKFNEVLDYLKAKILFKGKVIDVIRRIEKGFSRGFVVIEGMEEYSNKSLKIDFQNEFLIATLEDNVLVSVPDLITVLDMFTFKPITTDRIKYGQKVLIIGIPAHERLRTKEALKYIGPRVFGYNIDYEPIEKRNDVTWL
ncbi:DUF917 domain-containing protein [Sulfolobus acidocaldarius]|uniref:DUF917 domain-containing protein n=3 Tax=Sulfolobus acidocaldarius TaxID=2285 RepID=Q4J798_SULAC|nr:DUF917 domain-containing protein [Sulfolobus acidocaldarius]AAY81333.1 hypothetical protein Saci_2037 [Sulfolobus acidocaldarius DSM 639]AGE74247.1 hypothetical protein SacRon12I_10145 [Sulfolobus acidocaldarius Ron12/I]ALU29867.1 hypothetical protein ATY89_07890 [Sulfolobus acidocaldarius]ALU32607.1 hypothetical protein ATZ20_10910 [Sulfolobus acidocaldarius]WCM35835.1 DUF917 family protein [Sulfolobus acidocaldarius DSM 639]